MRLIIDQTRAINHPSPEQIAASLAAFDEFVVLELDQAGESLQALEQEPGLLLVEHLAADAHRTMGVVPRETAIGLFQAAARGAPGWRGNPLWRPEGRASAEPDALAWQRSINPFVKPFNLAEARKLFKLVVIIGLGGAVIGYGLPALTNPRQRRLLFRDLPGMAVEVVGGVLAFAALIVFYYAVFSLLRPAIARWLSGVLGVTIVHRSESPRHPRGGSQGMNWAVREARTGKDFLVGLLDVTITLSLVMSPFIALIGGILLYFGSR